MEYVVPDLYKILFNLGREYCLDIPDELRLALISDFINYSGKYFGYGFELKADDLINSDYFLVKYNTELFYKVMLLLTKLYLQIDYVRSVKMNSHLTNISSENEIDLIRCRIIINDFINFYASKYGLPPYAKFTSKIEDEEIQKLVLDMQLID